MYKRETIDDPFQELESLPTYPVEILQGQLYMGDYKQATSYAITKDLKISAFVNVSDQNCSLWVWCETFTHNYLSVTTVFAAIFMLVVFFSLLN